MSFSEADIQLTQIRYLRGPNVWTFRSALEVWLDLGCLEDHPSNQIPGLIERLTAWLPSLQDHHCGVGEVGGFIQRLHEGTWAGHVLEHVVIELLNLAGMPTGFGQTRSTSRRGVYRMVFRARDERVARAALAQGHALLMAAIRGGHPFDVDASVAVVREAIDEWYLGPSTACIVAAATQRNIPHIRLNDGNLVQLGYGARQHRIWTAETDRTSAIAESIAGDKDLTKTLIKAVGVPVPEGESVTSAEQAWEVAQDLGLPVVVKPCDGNHGRGVSLDLNSRDDILQAFEHAQSQGNGVLVERCIPGHEHRLLVVGQRLVAAAKGESAWMVGDGIHTISELLDLQINSDPRRGTTEDHPLNRLNLDEDEVVRQDLWRQGYSPDAVPPSGARILVQRNGNVAHDCTDDVHPEVAAMAVLAARTVGLDIAGIDLVAQDISQPLEAQGAAVVEVNAGPGLLVHLRPASGQPRPVGEAIVEHLFPSSAMPDQAGRVPLVGIAGSRHTSQIARALAWLTHLAGHVTGLACSSGVFIARRRIQSTGTELQKHYWDACQRLLMNRDLLAAVFENGPELILQDGLPYDRCQVGVVTDFDGWRELAHHDIHSAADMHRVMRTQIDVVQADGTGILNGDDPLVAALAELCDGDVILYGLQGADGPAQAIARHLTQGGKAVLADHEGQCFLCTGMTASAPHYLPLNGLAMLCNGEKAPWSTDALLPTIAAAWAMGMSPNLISKGLETFHLQAS